MCVCVCVCVDGDGRALIAGVITSTTSDDDGNLVAAEIRWGDVARLRVESTAMAAGGSRHQPRTRAPWNENLEEGFVVDFAVNPELAGATR